MISSILIIGFSLVLLVYWFRYSCMLLLQNRSTVSVSPASEDSRFHLEQVQAGLRTGSELDPLHAALQRDYAVLTYLLEHAAGLELQSFEARLLVFDYKLMRGWYRLTRTAAPERARGALAEMASVLEVLVGRIGERARLHSAV